MKRIAIDKILLQLEQFLNLRKEVNGSRLNGDTN